MILLLKLSINFLCYLNCMPIGGAFLDSGLITILDGDEAYASKLADYFRIKSGLDHKIQIFTSFPSLSDFLEHSYTDILLISHDLLCLIQDFNNIGSIFILKDSGELESPGEYTCIYKYQSSDQIVKEVITGYAIKDHSLPFKKPHMNTNNIISVYSPVKRCGKTSFSLVLGNILSKHSETLYISFEDYSGFQFYSEKEYLNDFSDLLYFYNNAPDKLEQKLISISQTINAMSYIPPMRFSVDLKTIDTGIICHLIEDISSLGKYKYIILDLSDSLCDISPILNISHTIYSPIIDDQISRSKLSDFYNYLDISQLHSIKDKIREIILPEYTYPQDGSVIQSLTFSNLGSYVKTLIEEDFNNE